MNKYIPTLICPLDEKLLERVKEFPIIIRIDDLGLLSEIKTIKRAFFISEIIIEDQEDLSSIKYENFPSDLKINVFANRLGNFKTLIDKLNVIRKLNTILFLSDFSVENITSLQILSSLGVHCGLKLSVNKNKNWEKIIDLMFYTIYSKVQHAPIEPFYFIIKNYKPRSYIDFNKVFFNNPKYFLHLNHIGEIALTKEELLAKKFIISEITDIEKIVCKNEYIEKCIFEQNFFINKEICSYCPGWSLCLGKFAALKDHGRCSLLFEKLFEALNLIYQPSNRCNND